MSETKRKHIPYKLHSTILQLHNTINNIYVNINNIYVNINYIYAAHAYVLYIPTKLHRRQLFEQNNALFTTADTTA
jgi:hypothetical protein